MSDQQAEKIIALLTEIRDLTKIRNEAVQAVQQQAEAVSQRQADALAEVKGRRADERKRMYITAVLVLVCLVMFAVGIIIIMTRR